jgi:hypothetical protein
VRSLFWQEFHKEQKKLLEQKSRALKGMQLEQLEEMLKGWQDNK